MIEKKEQKKVLKNLLECFNKKNKLKFQHNKKLTKVDYLLIKL